METYNKGEGCMNKQYWENWIVKLNEAGLLSTPYITVNSKRTKTLRLVPSRFGPQDAFNYMIPQAKTK